MPRGKRLSYPEKSQTHRILLPVVPSIPGVRLAWRSARLIGLRTKKWNPDTMSPATCTEMEKKIFMK
jgi:hypothetical protein